MKASDVPGLFPRLGAPFSDGMVVQHDRSLRVWGWDVPGAGINICLGNNSTRTIAAADGAWEVEIEPPRLGSGSRPLEIRGTERLLVRDVVAGEVWLAAGQSNMEMAVRDTAEVHEILPDCEISDIRSLVVPQRESEQPERTINAGWKRSDRGSVRGMSAVGWHFARSLHRELDIPVGIIQAALGGSGYRGIFA